MINSSANTPIQAFPVETKTGVFSGAVTAIVVKGPMVVHMLTDGNITARYNTDGTPASVVIPAANGTDWAIAPNFDSIDVDAACVISPA
jgi:hypothetical protein